MSERSKIEWTDASWNPTTGCTKVSAGCTNCYAETLALRLQKMGSKRYRNAFTLTLHEDALNLPLKWKKPKKIFVNSMSDMFHKDVPDKFIDKVWDVMAKANWHIYQILTKRPERMAQYSWTKEKLPNVWLGTSVEYSRVKDRIKALHTSNAKIRFISFEPLIGDVGKLDLSNIHWVIVGGESGKNHRPIEREWVTNILAQCKKQNVAFFFKQWGGLKPKSGGRQLNGRTYDEYPNLR